MFFLISTTYALSLSPVAMCLEELIPASNPNFNIYSKLIRTALVLSTLLVGLLVPFFGKLLFYLPYILSVLVPNFTTFCQLTQELVHKSNRYEGNMVRIDFLCKFIESRVIYLILSPF